MIVKEQMDGGGKIINTRCILPFVLGGHAVFTLKSVKTGVRFTYRAVRPKKDSEAPVFVSLLMGADNTSDYRYIATLFSNERVVLRHTKKSAVAPDAKSFKALDYLIRVVQHPEAPEQLPAEIEFWHQGSCGRCGRPLTDPTSIASGLGPVCAAKGMQ